MINRFIINFPEIRQRNVESNDEQFLEENAYSKLTAIISYLNNRSENFQIVIQVIDDQMRQNTKTIHPVSESLSKRELQVFELALQGCTNKQIAAQLFISIETVRSHRKQIVSKAGVKKIEEIKDWLLKKSF